MPPSGTGPLSMSKPILAGFVDADGVPLTDVEDPDQIISFLCQKFSGLIEKVRIAEAQQAEVQEKANELETRIREASDRRQVTSMRLQSALKCELVQAEKVQQRLHATHSSVDFLTTELRRAKEVVNNLTEQCQEIGSRCRDEQRCAEDVVGLIAAEDEAWAACDRERDSLRTEIQALTSKLAMQEETLISGRERDRHRRSDLRSLDERLQEAGRLHQVAERRSQALQEELENTHAQVLSYRERLERTSSSWKDRDEELRQHEGRLQDLLADGASLEQQATSAHEALGHLKQLKAKLEEAVHENIEAQNTVKATQLTARNCRDVTKVLDARQQENVQKLANVSESVAATGADLVRWQQRTQALVDSISQLRRQQAELEELSRNSGHVGVALKADLQRVFLEVESLRRDRDEVATSAAEVQRRLIAAEPALETTRLRARELEETAEDMEGELNRARQNKESLMREVSQCREKMRGLRKRHVALSEKAQTLEKRLLKSSGNFGGPRHDVLAGTASFAAAAAAAAAANTTATVASLPLTSATSGRPRSVGNRSKSSTQLLNAAAHPRSRPSSIETGPGSPGEAESLGLLRHWIELEEARIGVARAPPQPSPLPCSLFRHDFPATQPHHSSHDAGKAVDISRPSSPPEGLNEEVADHSQVRPDQTWSSRSGLDIAA